MSEAVLTPPLRAGRVTAVLGPTNTGKTHHAIERMLAYPSGLIALPLRLLAREVYGRLVERVGERYVALITGEEKITPHKPRYYVATAEAAPRDLSVDFVAIDEIQLAADFDRGHVFTDHLLNRRGREETMLLGSAIMKPLIRALLPDAEIVERPRLSQLSYAGDKKITRLPPRSAIVAFSAEEVYAIAELLRRQRGGAAVVMGALSPRTRNAQVDLFQNGDVDHIVATDAIGMGLNLDIQHVGFAGDAKYDGRIHRRLYPAEMGQIAGRAGRHLRDGTFGTTGRCAPFDAELIELLETHQFEPLRVLNWRNPKLDFASVDALRESLAQLPNRPGLARAPRADDEVVFDLAAADIDVRDRLSGKGDVERLWQVAALPDFRKIAPNAHAELVGQIFVSLTDKGEIAEDWFQRQVNMCDRVDGDIDTLSARIAQIRTWTFCANRDWLTHRSHWQGVTRRIEDRLSDALHERLTERFVDRRTSVLMRRLRENVMLETQVDPSGQVTVEGQPVGRLQGFRFQPELGVTGSEAKALSAAAARALGQEIDTRASKLAVSNDEAFALGLDGSIRWQGEPVARILAGETILQPRHLLLADDILAGGARESVDERIAKFLKAHLAKHLGTLFALEAGEGLEGIARGIAFQLSENLGVLERTQVQQEIKALDQPSRSALRKMGVRFGAWHIVVPLLLKPAPRALAAQLWQLQHGGPDAKGLDEIAHFAASGRTSFAADASLPKGLYKAAGFKLAGSRAIRVDILERLADLIRPAIAFRPGVTPGEPPPGSYSGDGFTITGAMTSLVGCAGEDFASLMKALGYRVDKKPPLAPFAIIPVAIVPADAVKPEGATTETPATAEDGQPDAAAPLSEAAPLEPAPSAEAVEPTTVEASEEGEVAQAEPVQVAEASTPTEPELIDVWRVARGDRDRPQRRPNRPQRASAPADGQTAGSGEAGAGPDRSPSNRHAGGRKPWQKRDGDSSERQARPQQGEARGPDRKGRDFDKRGPKSSERGSSDRRPSDRRDGDRGASLRMFSSDAPKSDKGLDPNSPFAQLAALKAKMEGKS
jgi:ATP-dependent RNA helicase SUPV3L1/SUV3